MQLDRIYDRLQKDMDALNDLVEELANSDFSDADEVMQRLYNKLLLTAKFVANNKSKAGLDENTESQPSLKRKRVIDSQDENTEEQLNERYADKFGEHVALENGQSVNAERQIAYAERVRQNVGCQCKDCEYFNTTSFYCSDKKKFVGARDAACGNFIKR